MPTANLDGFRLILEAKRQELQSEALDRDEILIEKVADEFDRLQQQLSREVAISKLDRESKLLKDVQAAIARTKDGTFGTACTVRNNSRKTPEGPSLGGSLRRVPGAN